MVGLTVVAFIVVSERFGARLYPVGSAPWRRLLVPCIGSLSMGYLLYRFFPDARGSRVPQTKAALYARDGRITLSTVAANFLWADESLEQAVARVRKSTDRTWTVIDRGGVFGLLNRDTVETALISSQEFSHVHTDHSSTSRCSAWARPALMFYQSSAA